MRTHFLEQIKSAPLTLPLRLSSLVIGIDTRIMSLDFVIWILLSFPSTLTTYTCVDSEIRI